MKSGKSPRDPLLAIARFLLKAAMAITALAVAAIVITIPALMVFHDWVVGKLAGHSAPPETIWAIISVLGLAAAMAVLGFYFFRHLYRIVASVGDGDPFVPINARRLHAMGWITVAVHVIGIPMSVLSGWIESVTDKVRVVFELPLAGILLAVVLFVLARVFREGTRMREELEGTV